jgi:ABC-type cobalamin/Fe3+-siderophores transport system ATPase subunit
VRLRYLHLKNYPPINDIAVAFSNSSPLNRECAIRFVIGVNGSGKSNLLRAVAEVFLALSDLRVPPFPVSLIYELGIRNSANFRTLLLHCPGTRNQASLWVKERNGFADNTDAASFNTYFEQLNSSGRIDDQDFSPLYLPGEWPLRNSTPPQIALPSAVLAYTTGDLRPWRSVWSRNQDARGLFDRDEAESSLNEERPPGWTTAQEFALVTNREIETQSAPPIYERNIFDRDTFRRPLLLDNTLIKCALLAVVLPHSVKELADNIEKLPDVLKGTKPSGVTELLKRGGLQHLVSVGFRSHLNLSGWDRKLCETAYDWWQCAGEILAEPSPRDTYRTLFFDIKGAFHSEEINFSSPARGELEIATTQGEALWALLGGARNATAFELFTRLLELSRAGFFSDVFLRLRRQATPDVNSANALDDIGVLRFEELSDGEQMVLGRMALFHLLQDQQDALLLLDEPETHFNDTWKREIVDIIDDAIRNTANDVLISTHSAIVLSDVFNDEIVMVKKTPEGSGVRSVNEPTFATDPSALMMTVFGTEDSIGKRAQEFIEAKLRQPTGTSEELAQLETLISRMGSGFYRSELRTLLNIWKKNNA